MVYSLCVSNFFLSKSHFILAHTALMVCLSLFGLLWQKLLRLSDLNNTYFSLFMKLGSPRSRGPADLMLVRICFLVHEQPSSCSVITWSQNERALWASFVRVLILLMKAPPQCPDYLPKAPTPITITLGVNISTHTFLGDTDIQSVIWFVSITTI